MAEVIKHYSQDFKEGYFTGKSIAYQAILDKIDILKDLVLTLQHEADSSFEMVQKEGIKDDN